MAVRQQDPAHLLDQIENLSRTHREHELYYSQAPLDDAAALQRISRTLKALAGHWRTATPLQVDGANRYAGCDDLNVQAAIEQLGVLFLEGEGEPAEITRIKRELATRAADHELPPSSRARTRSSTRSTSPQPRFAPISPAGGSHPATSTAPPS